MKIPTTLTHFIRFLQRRIKCNRSYSAVADSNSNEKVTEVTRKTSVANYLSLTGSTSLIKHLIPNDLHPRRMSVYYHYLINEKTAEELASLIVNKLSPKELNCVIAECNPTFGLLTKKLLEKGVPKLHLYETKLRDKGPLVDLLQNYQNRLVLHPIQFLKFWTLPHNDEFQKSFAQERQLTEWDEDVSMVVIAAVADLQFIQSVIKSMVKRNIGTEYGRFKMFLVMKPSDWTKLTSTNETRNLYRWQAILFQIMFNYQFLGKLDRQSFLPWSRYKRYVSDTVYRNMIKVDKKEMYVVMIEPIADLFTLYFNEDELKVFYYFVQHCARCRSRKVIPELEKWAPGCGIKLISLGYNIFTDFGDLIPDEIFNVYRVIITNLNFDKEEFLTQMENVGVVKDDHEIATSVETAQPTED